MKIRLVLALSFSALVSFSSPAKAEDLFQRLLDLAATGENLTFSAAEGVYTGRCYDKINRNLPRSSVLAIFTSTPKNYNGPLSPDQPQRYILEGGYSGFADRADFMSRETILSDLWTLRSSYGAVTDSPLSVTLAMDKLSSMISLFKNGDYLISYFTALSSGTAQVRGDGALNLEPGDVWAACYYFNKK